MPHSRELAELLLRKAEQDEFALDKLIPDPNSPDEIIGFHAQQAIEKMLKAVLAFAGVRYRWTHDLVELLDLLRKKGITYPEEFEEVTALTPFAAILRYEDEVVQTEKSFDRLWARDCVRKVRAWAESALRDIESG
jgi:HEPN domain-containing protein